jgi:cytochrome c oxidase assembly protein subunit 15
MADSVYRLAEPDSPWPHRLALLTAVATFPLLFVGGLVTSTGAGLAVPDWPTTFGYNMFLYPWSQMVGGIFYEHVHRLIGSAVGILTVTCAALLWLREDRRWMRALGVAAVVAVVGQGILGGLRVVLLEHGLAIIHGCVAQAFFALMLSIAVCTSSWWRIAPQVQPPPDAGLRLIALCTTGLMYLQVIFGALLTHRGRLDAHLLCAGLVVIAVALLSARVGLYHSDPALRRPALLLAVLLGIQLSLGLGTYIWRFTQMSQSMSATFGLALQTTHRVTGAALLGTSVVLALRILRLSGEMSSAPLADRQLRNAFDATDCHQVPA